MLLALETLDQPLAGDLVVFVGADHPVQQRALQLAHGALACDLVGAGCRAGNSGFGFLRADLVRYPNASRRSA